jgi:hypothetical protein
MNGIYNISMKIVLAGGLTEALNLISRQLTGLHTKAGELEKKFGNLGNAMLYGAGAAVAGGGMIGAMEKIMKKADEFSHEMANLKIFNMPAADMAKMQAAARATAQQVRGMTTTNAYALANQSWSILGADNTAKILPDLAKMERALAGIYKDSGKAHEQMMLVTRTSDLLGKFVDPTTHQIDLDRFRKFSDLQSRIAAGTHGRVGPAQWMMLAQQGGPAISTMDDEGLTTMAMVSQGMGGFRSGTAITSLRQQLDAGQMPERVAKELKRLDLVGNFTHGPGGKLIWDEGALNTEFAQLMHKDPLKAAEYFQKALESHGFKDIESQTTEIFKVFGRQPTQRIVSDLVRNLPQMLAEQGRLGGVMGTDAQLDVRNKTDQITAMQNLHAAWDNMWLAIAGPNSENYIKILGRLESLFKAIGDWAMEHPHTMQLIAEAFTTLGAALAIGGGATAGATILAAIGPSGWFIAGLIGLAGAFAIVEPFLSKFLKEYGKAFSEGKAAPNAADGSGIDPMGSYSPGMIHKESYHPGGGANDNYSWSDIGGGRGGSIKDAARARAFGASGSSMMSYAMDQLRKEGVPESSLHAAAANLVGQAYMESGLDPSKVHDGGTGYGIYGARLGRRAAMFQWLSAHGYARNSAEGQMRYMAHEAMSGRYGFTKHALQSGLFGEGVTNRITGEFESPAHINRRHDAVMRAYRSDRSRKAITEGVTPPPRKQSQPIIQFDAHLDGEVLSRTVTKRQSRSSMFATSSGDIDPHGRYHDAGTRFSDVG